MNCNWKHPVVRSRSPMVGSLMFIAISGSILLAGCNRSGGTGTATPKGAAAAFFKALAAGDLDGVRATSVGFEDAYPLVGNSAAANRELQRFETTITARFKDHARFVSPDVIAGMGAAMERMKESVDGDTATLIDQADPNAPFSFRCKREAGVWKLDLSEPRSHAALVKLLTSYGRSAQAYAEINPKLEQGKFKSDAEALAALQRAMTASPGKEQ